MIRKIAVVIALTTSPMALADFSAIAPVEWNSWPEYCKAKHLSFGTGGQAFMERDRARVAQTDWESLLGDKTWNNIHHGCRGILHIARAERMRGKSQQNYLYQLGQAESEANYSFERTPAGHPLYYKMASILARVDYERGNKGAGIAKLKGLLKEAPDSAELHAILAMYLFREGKFDEARRVLENGLETVSEPTAEMHYFLGLVLVKQQAWEEARKHAAEAYRLGYPLPALRNKLKAVGHWVE